MNQLITKPKPRSVTVTSPKLFMCPELPYGITPSQSVIEGWNGTIGGVLSLAASIERSKAK